MKIIYRFFAIALMSVFANVVVAQTSKITLEPAKITAEEAKAVELKLRTNTPEVLNLETLEVELFSALAHNGNQEITACVAEDGALGLPFGTEFSSYLLREDNGFSLLYTVKTKNGSIAKGCSERLTIVPPHAELSASEIQCLKEKIAISPEKLGLEPIDVQAFNRLLQYGNQGTFGMGYTEDDYFGCVPVHNGYCVEGYIIRIDDGVSLYYNIYNGQADRLEAIRQTPVISLN